nr:transposase [Streptomyces pseudovenezuelae]
MSTSRSASTRPPASPARSGPVRSGPVRSQCTNSPAYPRLIALLPRPLHEIQTRNRLDQATEQWQRRYAIRAGIESTLSENVRVHGRAGPDIAG